MSQKDNFLEMEGHVMYLSRCASRSCKPSVFMSSLLVLGNVLGVGVLALPITAGLGGYFPALIGITSISIIMLISAWLITYRIDPNKKNFDMPSFYDQELGRFAKVIAVGCNLIILYGVLVAYLSGISSMFSSIFPILKDHTKLIIIVYFSICSTVVLCGTKVLRKGMVFIIACIWISFFVMIISAFSVFNPVLLQYNNWTFFPVCLPIAVSAFHFHNIIPTVAKGLNYDKKATCKAILIGVLCGLVINLSWITVVLGALPTIGPGQNTISYANVHSLLATVPLSHVLHNKFFTVAGVSFALLAVSSAFITNGAGLYGFIKDLSYHHLKTDRFIVVASIAFAPVLTVALVYPSIFLNALSLVGGIGEDILFGILPAIIIIKIVDQFRLNRNFVRAIASFMLVVSCFVLCFVVWQKTNEIGSSIRVSLSHHKSNLGLIKHSIHHS